MTVRDQIVAGAQRWLGSTYDWGGEGLNGEGVDCSGLVIAAYREAGTPLSGRPIASQLGQMGSGISLWQAQPGDVVYYDEPGPTDHVGIFIGDGKMINAPYEGAPVRVDEVGTPTSVRRLVNSSGALTAEDAPLDPDSALGNLFIPGYGAIKIAQAADDAVSGWAGEALAIGVKLIGTVAALALVVGGVMHTVKDGKD